MPSVTIPLTGQDNARIGGLSTQDQSFKNFIPTIIKNSISGDNKFYLEKRFGWVDYFTPAAGSYCFGVSVFQTAFTSVWGADEDALSFTVYRDSTIIGTTDTGGRYPVVSTATLGGIFYVFISTTNGAYYYSNQGGSSTFTGNTSSGSAVVTGIANTASYFVGQKLSGTGIQTDSRILTIDSSSQITMNKTATANGTGVTISREKLSKIMDSDYPTGTVGKIVSLDGFFFVMTSDGKIYNSDLNSVTSWSASNYLTVSGSSQYTGVGLEVIGGKIVAFSLNSFDVAYNAGNPSGSVLQIMKERKTSVGAERSQAISRVDDLIFWFNSPSAYLMLGDGSYKKISTEGVENRLAINKALGARVTRACAFKFYGRTFYCVNIYTGSGGTQATPDIIQVYCLERDCWLEFSGDYFQNIDASNYGDFGELLFSASSTSTSGKILKSSVSSFQDNGSTITATARTSKTDFGTENLKTVKNVALLGSDIQGAINYLSLDGSSGCYASTPDSASVSVTGDIDLRVKAALDDWTPSATVSILDKRASSNISYALRVASAGNIILSWSTDGTTEVTRTSTTTPTVSNGAILWVRATLDVSSGGNHDVVFYTSIDGSTWTQLGSTVTTAGTTSLFDGTARLSMGASYAGTLERASGDFYYAEVRNGIGGTVVAKFAPSNDASEGDTSFTSSVGEVWTINGTASIEDGQVATLEYSDDDYSTWTTAGEFKLTTSNPRIYRLGAYRGGRAWRLTHSADSAFRAQALKFEYDVGRH